MSQLPPGWRAATLGELTSTTRPICYGVLKPGPYVGGGVPLLRIQDLPRNAISIERVHLISEALDREFERSRLNGGEVLLSIQGTIGRTAIVPNALRGANISRTLAVIAPDDRLDRRLLYYYLQYLASVGGYETGGSTRASLNIGTIRSMSVPLPPVPEQKRIVAAIEEHLSRLDAGLGLIGSARTRLGRFEEAVEARTLAGDWPSATLESLAEFVTDGDHRPPPRVAIGVPHLTAKHVRNGRLSFESCTFVSEAGYSQTSARYEPRSGDVIVTCVGTVGEVAVVPPGVRFSADRNLAAIRLTAVGPARPDWVAAVLSTTRYRRRLKGASGSTAQPHLYLKDLRRLELPVPPLPIQDSLLGEHGDLRQSHAHLEDSLSFAERRGELLRKSILAAAFSGQLVSQDSDDEPAAASLERIQAERQGANPTKRTRKARAS